MTDINNLLKHPKSSQQESDDSTAPTLRLESALNACQQSAFCNQQRVLNTPGWCQRLTTRALNYSTNNQTNILNTVGTHSVINNSPEDSKIRISRSTVNSPSINPRISILSRFRPELALCCSTHFLTYTNHYTHPILMFGRILKLTSRVKQKLI